MKLKPFLTLVWCVLGPVMTQQRTFTFAEWNIVTSDISGLIRRGEMKKPNMKPRPGQSS